MQDNAYEDINDSRNSYHFGMLDNKRNAYCDLKNMSKYS